MKNKLTHFNADGKPQMVDVSNKKVTKRLAKAMGRVYVNKDTYNIIKSGNNKKGDVLTVAQLAGIMAAKKTSDLIPLAHPIMIEGIDVKLELNEKLCSVDVLSTITISEKTGVEMEALTACSVACLTVYDMCKAVQKDMVISDIKLLSKSGGSHGDFKRKDK